MRNKNPAAVALGRRTSPAKKRAAIANGKLGGAPTRERRFIAALDRAINFHAENTNDPHNIGSAVICALNEVKEAFRSAYKP